MNFSKAFPWLNIMSWLLYFYSAPSAPLSTLIYLINEGVSLIVFSRDFSLHERTTLIKILRNSPILNDFITHFIHFATLPNVRKDIIDGMACQQPSLTKGGLDTLGEG